MMAQPQIPAMKKQILTVIRDRKGRILAILPTEEEWIPGPNNSIIKRRTNEGEVLGCGSVYYPAMSLGANPTMMLASCQSCGQLCDREAGHVCYGCSAFMCPRHSRRCSDGNWRCHGCAYTAAFKRSLLGFFFKDE